jgi:hypothetical protein
MKKLCLFSIIFFIAQTGFTQNLRFGLKAAPSMGWLKPDTKGLTTNGSKIGFSYGIMTDFGFTDNYYLATGVDVTYRGGSLTDKRIDTVEITTDYRLQYIELPITLKMKTNEIGYLTYFGQFGFAPGLRISSKGDIETKFAGQAGTNNLDDEDISDAINNLTLSMIISLGAEYNLGGRTSILTALTFNNGFVDVLDDKDLKATSNYFALTLGVFF